MKSAGNLKTEWFYRSQNRALQLINLVGQWEKAILKADCSIVYLDENRRLTLASRFASRHIKNVLEICMCFCCMQVTYTIEAEALLITFERDVSSCRPQLHQSFPYSTTLMFGFSTLEFANLLANFCFTYYYLTLPNAAWQCVNIFVKPDLTNRIHVSVTYAGKIQIPKTQAPWPKYLTFFSI